MGTLGSQLNDALGSYDGRSGYKFELPMGITGRGASRLLLEAALCYEQDYGDIRRGAYRQPWDMKSLGHRQSSPLNVATQSARFVREAVGTMQRRKRGSEEDKRIRISEDSDPSLYPDYYRTAFHYQTDGWMSKQSADIYETSTETLFLGRQDAMQRSALPLLLPAAQRRGKIASDRGRPLRVLEVACGTGRFMTFVRDNLPLPGTTEVTAVDLSPFYLDVARDNDSYWRRTRQAEEREGPGRSVTRILPVRLVQAKAEDLPFAPDSFDVVLCVYLFHELPREVRARAAAEMARVVAPGGTVVFTDSIQIGDRPALDSVIQNFENMNEPYYADYLLDDLAGHFQGAGLTCERKMVRSMTKSLSFSKPEEA